MTPMLEEGDAVDETFVKQTRHGDVLFCRYRVNLRHVATLRALRDAEPGRACVNFSSDRQIEFGLRRPSVEVEVGAEAQRVNRLADAAREILDRSRLMSETGASVNRCVGRTRATVRGSFQSYMRAKKAAVAAMPSAVDRSASCRRRPPDRQLEALGRGIEMTA